LHGPFDIIFIDCDKHDYIELYDMIMDRKLLAQDGIILADNVLALGCTVDSKLDTPGHDSAIRNGAELRKFNDHIAADDRVDVCVLPMFDGLALIKWRPNMYPLQRVQSHLSIHNITNGVSRPRSIHRGSFDLHNPVRSPSRNSHDFSRTSTPSFPVHRLSDEEIEEKDEFSYGFSNRRGSDEGRENVNQDWFKGNNPFVHPVGGYESRNKYYD
jgi:O-methyltransferase